MNAQRCEGVSQATWAIGALGLLAADATERMHVLASDGFDDSCESFPEASIRDRLANLIAVMEERPCCYRWRKRRR